VVRSSVEIRTLPEESRSNTIHPSRVVVPAEEMVDEEVRGEAGVVEEVDEEARRTMLPCSPG